MPQEHAPLVAALPPAEREALVAIAARHAEAVAARLPDHAEFVARHCAAPPPTESRTA